MVAPLPRKAARAAPPQSDRTFEALEVLGFCKAL
jgi:hypothetical protein